MFSKSLRKFREFDDERKFTDAKLKMVKDFKNKLVEAPFRKAFGVLTQILINGKFSYEEDLLNMTHVLEDLAASGWRPGEGFTMPPASPNRNYTRR